MEPVNPLSTSTPALDLTSYFDHLQLPTADGGALSGLSGGVPGASQAGDPVSSATAFTQALTGAIGSVAGLEQTADQAAAGLALNRGVDIHQAMIAMEQASLGMQMTVQVRDKAVEAYQSLINMQM